MPANNFLFFIVEDIDIAEELKMLMEEVPIGITEIGDWTAEFFSSLACEEADNFCVFWITSYQLDVIFLVPTVAVLRGRALIFFRDDFSWFTMKITFKEETSMTTTSFVYVTPIAPHAM